MRCALLGAAGATALVGLVALGLLNDSTLTLKVFAYDFNEPDIAKILLTLAEQGRVRVILDNASLHVTPAGKDAILQGSQVGANAQTPRPPRPPQHPAKLESVLAGGTPPGAPGLSPAPGPKP